MNDTETRHEDSAPVDFDAFARTYALETVERVTLCFLAAMYAEAVFQHMTGAFDDAAMRWAHGLVVSNADGEITGKLPSTVHFKRLAEAYLNTVGTDRDSNEAVRATVMDAMRAMAAMM